MKNFIIRFFHKLVWIKNGKPTVTLPGCNCGCCGKWIDKSFTIIDIDVKKSIVYHKGDEWPDKYWFVSWGLCDTCGRDEL